MAQSKQKARFLNHCVMCYVLAFLADIPSRGQICAMIGITKRAGRVRKHSPSPKSNRWQERATWQDYKANQAHSGIRCGLLIAHRKHKGRMITQVIPGFDLVGFEAMAFERQTKFTGDDAHRLGLVLADVICRTFPGTDKDLMAKQIESDFIEWANQVGRLTYRKGPGGMPRRLSPQRRAELASVAEETKTRWGLR